MHRAPLILASLGFALLTACGGSGPASPGDAAAGGDSGSVGGTSGAIGGTGIVDRPATLIVTTANGTVDLTVEVADTQDERERGLMGREDLGPLDGMAFVWRHPTTGGFWMKDTLIPLSIAFWDADGRIVAILDMEPCEADPCPIYDPGVTYGGAVEVEQGTFEREGIEVGDPVTLETG